ncbi:unnamed protein product [Pleuronectes platessa]|uniref:Uncharacterized protein n=1 Tax=Pleuronectes platessa TaxID=8262 RepID=A0A9N7TIE6_PLEPL|nr:unnamed protein product [Pleuronectes platessa]
MRSAHSCPGPRGLQHVCWLVLIQFHQSYFIGVATWRISAESLETFTRTFVFTHTWLPEKLRRISGEHQGAL